MVVRALQVLILSGPVLTGSVVPAQTLSWQVVERDVFSERANTSAYFASCGNIRSKKKKEEVGQL